MLSAIPLQMIQMVANFSYKKRKKIMLVMIGTK